MPEHFADGQDTEPGQGSVVLPRPDRSTRKPRSGTRRRRERLSELLQDLGEQASIRELTEHFGVSEATLRRDITALSESGDLLRVYGGAAPARKTETTWREKAANNGPSKRLIAKFSAAELVNPGDVVFIDAGTTPAAVGRELADRADITIVAAGLAGLLEVTEGKARVIVLGGQFRPTSASFLGPIADHLMDFLTPDVAFLGTDHLDPGYGANYPDPEQALFKNRVMGRANRNWLVVDETKFEGPAPFRHWAPLSRTTGIVTVLPAEEKSREAVEEFSRLGHPVHALSPDHETNTDGLGS